MPEQFLLDVDLGSLDLKTNVWIIVMASVLKNI